MATKAVLFLLFCCWALSPCPANDGAVRLRVATYNLNWGNPRVDLAVEAIRASHADIVFLQETTPASENFLREQLRGTHPHMHFVGHQGRYWAERFGFVSNIPLSGLAFEPPSAGLFGSFLAECTLGGTQVTLVNVHLSPFLFDRGGGIGDFMKSMNETEDVHAAEIAAICQRFDPRQPAIVAGDFNSPATLLAPSHLTGIGLIDSFASVTDDADSHATWRWPTRPLPVQFRIDYVFHTSHFRTSESQILTRVGSDHSLVVSELTLSQRAEKLDSPETVENGQRERRTVPEAAPTWYESLEKPSWTPSPATISLIWRILYPIIFASFGFVFLQAIRRKLPWSAAWPFAINLVANLLFIPILFGLRNLSLAAIDILVVWLTIGWMMAAVWKHYRWVAIAQIPYFVWVSIATVLQLSITWSNW